MAAITVAGGNLGTEKVLKETTSRLLCQHPTRRRMQAGVGSLTTFLCNKRHG